MNFSDLLSLAQKNDRKAQVQIKSSNGPVTELRGPGKQQKLKPDLRVVQAQLQEHRRAQLAEKPKTGHQNGTSSKNSHGNRPPAKPANVPSRPPTSGPLSASSSGTLNKAKSTPNLSVQNRPSKPAVPGKPSAPQNTTSQNGSKSGDRRQNTSASTSQPISRSKSSSSSNLSLKSGSNTGNHSVAKHSTQPSTISKASRPELAYKPKIRPAAPVGPSFSALLKMASMQQADPEKSFAPPPPAQKCNLPPPRRDDVRSNGHSRILPASSSYSNRDPPRKGVPAPVKNSQSRDSSSSQVRPPVGQAGSRNGQVSQRTQAPVSASGYKGPGRPNPVSQGSLPGKSTNAAPQNQNRGGLVGQQVKNPVASRGPANARPQQPNSGPQPGIRPQPNGRTQKPDICPQPNGHPPQASNRSVIPPVARQAPATGRKVAPVGKAAPGPSGVRRVNSVYPNGPSFPAFRPPPRKRAQPDRYQDEDSDYDEEMADFIDDEDADTVPAVSDHIREIFGYDRRKYVGRDDDDDDLRDMEAGIHTVWREEERSAEIGRLEDEIAEEEELEEERRALQRKRDKMRKKKKFSDDDDD